MRRKQSTLAGEVTPAPQSNPSLRLPVALRKLHCWASGHPELIAVARETDPDAVVFCRRCRWHVTASLALVPDPSQPSRSELWEVAQGLQNGMAAYRDRSAHLEEVVADREMSLRLETMSRGWGDV